MDGGGFGAGERGDLGGGQVEDQVQQQDILLGGGEVGDRAQRPGAARVQTRRRTACQAQAAGLAVDRASSQWPPSSSKAARTARGASAGGRSSSA